MAKDTTWVAVLAVVLFVMATVFVFGPNVWRYYRNKKIVEIGVDAPAQIMEVAQTGKRYNYNPEIRITLLVQPAGRPPFSAAVVMVPSPTVLHSLHPGSTVKVKYNPGNHSQVTIVE